MSRNFKTSSFIKQEEPDIDRAWLEMRKMLDQKLPVKKGHRSRRGSIYFYRIAAMLLLIVAALPPGTIYDFKNNIQAKHPAQKTGILNNPALNNNGGVTGNTTIYDKEIKQQSKSGEGSHAALSFNQLLSKKKPLGSINLQSKIRQHHSGKYFVIRQLPEKRIAMKRIHGNPVLFESGAQYSVTKDETGHIESEKKETEEMHLPNNIPVTPKDTSIKNSIAAKNNEQQKNERAIGFEIGAYYNMGGSLSSIYPIAALTIPVSKKAFLSLGVGLHSQVKINNFSPKEFTVLNDTVNQAYFTVEHKNIRKAVYIDLPVSINYKVNNRITVNAGVQLSVLQHVDIKPEKKTFDFQADLSRQVSFPVYTTATSVTPYQAYAQAYTVMKTNGRFTAGVGYQLKNVAIKFQYAKSFSPNYSFSDFYGTKSEKRLSVFTIGMAYRIR